MNRLEQLRSGQRGFTLIEIVIALAILSVAVVALLGAQYSALVLTQDTLTATKSKHLMSEAAAIAEGAVLAGELHGSGDFDNAEGAAYAFTAEHVDPGFYPGLIRIQIEVDLDDTTLSFVFHVHDARQKF